MRHDDLAQLDERRPITLPKLQHLRYNVTKRPSVTRLQSSNPGRYQLLPIILLTLLVKSSNVVHSRQLEEEKAYREDI